MSKLASIGYYIFSKLLPKEEDPSNEVIPEFVLEGPVPEEATLGEPFPSPKQLKSRLFLYTKLADIETYWPIIHKALKADGLDDKQMLCYALATLYVENDRFKPLAETPSKYSTKGGKKPYDFSHYVGKGGNKTLADAGLYRGSGFIQLTLKDNYTYYDEKLKLDGGLVELGYVAGNEPNLASYIFSAFLKDREVGIRESLDARDFRKARTYVNGKTALHWQKLETAYKTLEKLF